MKAISKTIKQVVSFIIMTMLATQISGCNSNDNITSVSAADFDKEINENNVQLVDVRTPKEYAEGHIAGAMNINVQSDYFQIKAENELSKDSTILVYCRSGRRSMDAAKILAKLGYKVVNLEGGIIEWKESGHPVTEE